MFLSDVSYSSLSTFMPILLHKIGSKSSNSIEIYGTILLETSLAIPGAFLSAYLVTTPLGMKWTTSISFLISGICIFFFLVSSKYWMVLLSTCLINSFNFMGYAGLVAIIPESYPIHIRSLGVGWANAWCKFGGVISPVTIGLLIESTSGTIIAVFILACGFCGVGLISSLFDEPSVKSQNSASLNN